MLKFWPSSPAELTPKAGPDGKERLNPFDLPQSGFAQQPQSQSQSSSALRHHLLNASTSTSTAQPAPATSANGGDLTPLGTLSPNAFPIFAAAVPTTQLSLHAPDFNMAEPPQPKNKRSPPDFPPSSTSSPASSHKSSSSSTRSVRNPLTNALNASSSASSSANGSPGGQSKGQIHVKLIQARGLNVSSPHSRPYVVVSFEQNEFVSRDPIDETEKELKGQATNLSRNSSSVALSALGAINSKDAAKRSTGSGKNTPVPGAPKPNTSASGLTNSLFGRKNAHNPVWKHEVSFDVTSEKSTITFCVYDRIDGEHPFLGTVQVKPVLVHDHTVDQWYKLQPFENEVVTGEMRIQVTFEQFKNKRALTPRDFEFLKLIGRGTFGKVFQVRKKDTKRIYAMKVLSKKEIIAKKEVAHTIGERKILQRSLECPFLVGLKFSFQTDTDLYLVTDFKSGGELFWHLQKETRFSEERARFYVAELTLALEHLHKYDIVYRDLKPENILLDATGHVALCDFGLSKPDLRSDELTTTFCGTTEYLAPEVLLDEHGYSKLVDFWSLGVLLFEMCCGWSPFYAEDTQVMYKNICFGKIRFPKGVIGEEGKQFVKGLLNRNPKHRLGAQRDAAELKEHPFFASIDWDALARKQVTPPFKPVVESDDSTANFDPEFTTADLREMGLEDEMALDMDDADPSEAWVSASLTGGATTAHTPLGPLGSEKQDGIAIGQGKKAGKKGGSASPPLTNSVQENFRGFTYEGESLVHELEERLGLGGDEDEAVDEDENAEPTTEDEAEDFEHAGGRYARSRRRDDDMDL